MRMLKPLLLLCGTLLLAACVRPSTVPKIQPLAVTDTVRTLTAGVSLSIHTQRGGVSARGYLVYQQPDSFRLVITTPFGATVAELYGSDDSLSVVVPGKRTVYSGSIRGLLPQSPLRNWGRMRWVMTPLTERPGTPGTRERLTAEGVPETVVYDANGLAERMTTASGVEARYQGYRLYNGAAVPDVIEVADGYGDTVKLTLDDPEVNQKLDEGMVHPDSTGYEVYPLDEFKGF